MFHFRALFYVWLVILGSIVLGPFSEDRLIAFGIGFTFGELLLFGAQKWAAYWRSRSVVDKTEV